MSGSRRLLVFCYGTFAFAAQILLFRAYMTVLAGRDVGMGLYAAMSFFWLAVGAFLSERMFPRRPIAAGTAELLLLGGLPAFWLEYGLVIVLSAVVPTESHTALPFHFAWGWSLLSTAPLGVLLGLLFPLLYRRPQGSGNTPLEHLIALMAAGGVLGGLGVTVLLGLQLSPASVFLILAFIVCIATTLSVFAPTSGKARWVKRSIVAACLLATVAAGALRGDRVLTMAMERFKWSRVVSGGTFSGSFSTAWADYLYGTDQGRWVVASRSSVHETIGDTTASDPVAALALCQNGTATRVLIIGDGFSLCQSILKSPQIEAVDWYHPDPAYIKSLRAHLPDPFQTDDTRLHFLSGEIRTILAGRPDTYDIVIVNLAAPMNVAQARFASVEFFEAVESSLRGLGLLAFGVPGDANEPSSYPAYLGASIYHTLHATFAQTLVVPMDGKTFLLAGTSSYLELSPVILEVRFSLMRNAAAIFPPASLPSLYMPDRAVKILESYDAVDLPEDRLLIRDDRPSSVLCDLFAMTSRSGVSLAKPVRFVQRGGPLMAIVPLVLLALGRLLYVLRTVPRHRHPIDLTSASVLRADILSVIACMAAVGAGLLIIVMYACQQHHGSLHLHVGLIGALFLTGLALGTSLVGVIGASRPPGGSRHLYPLLCTLSILSGIHAVGFVAAGLWFDHLRAWPAFAVPLLADGACLGAMLGLGVRVLEICRRQADSSASDFAVAGSLGAAVGGGVALLLLIPLVGMQMTLFALAVPTLACVAFVIAAYHGSTRPGPRRVAHPTLTPIGYGLLALAACFIVDAHIVTYRETSRAKSQSTSVIQEWVENRRVSAKTASLAPASEAVTYLEVREGSRLKGYILRSEDFTDTVYGYGGPMSLVLFADPNGTLLDYRLTRSRETPRYIARIRTWMESLKGRTLFGATPLEGVHTVSGATLSCDAILTLLRRSGQQFAVSVLAQNDQPRTATRWAEKVDWPLVCWLTGVVLAFIAIWHGRIWGRIVVLAYAAIVTGFWLNRQYSTDHLMRLLDADALLAGPVSTLCLVLGVPLLVLLFGNIFCGYLCPFGALQELLSYLIPKRFKARLPLATITAGRFVKYLVLFTLVVAFFTTRTKRFLEADPLTMVFTRQFWNEGFWGSPALITAACVLVGTLLVTRLWCRYLCPTGAFLSLFNASGWLGRFLPAKKFGRCEFGLSGRDHLDCIHCDRCRYGSVLIPERSDVINKTAPRLATPLLLVFLVGLAVFTLSAVFRTSATFPSPSPPVATDAARLVQDAAKGEDAGPTATTEPTRGRRRRFRSGRNDSVPD